METIVLEEDRYLEFVGAIDGQKVTFCRDILSVLDLHYNTGKIFITVSRENFTGAMKLELVSGPPEEPEVLNKALVKIGGDVDELMLHSYCSLWGYAGGEPVYFKVDEAVTDEAAIRTG